MYGDNLHLDLDFKLLRSEGKPSLLFLFSIRNFQPHCAAKLTCVVYQSVVKQVDNPHIEKN